MLTARLYDARKLFAAAVMVTFLATLVSAVAIPEAGRRAVETPGSACHIDDLTKNRRMLRLELGEESVFTDSRQASCILHGLDWMLDADDLFLVSYSALNPARWGPIRRRRPGQPNRRSTACRG